MQSDASFTGIHFYPEYVTTGSFNRRLTWNPRLPKWEDTSEPGFACDRGNGAELAIPAVHSAPLGQG
jgi:hypothetical protein